MQELNVPEKANKILGWLLIVFILFALRIWNLTIIQREEKAKEALKPKFRAASEKPERGTIRDRFNIPLAMNKIGYDAAIVYSDIREIPAVAWEIGPDGKKVRVRKRQEYVRALSTLLSKELGIDEERAADLIHAKAAIFSHVPYVIKSDISEEQYYRLKALAKDWPGLHVQMGPKRYYPKHKAACHLIGYMGPISQEAYRELIKEKTALEKYLKEVEADAQLTPPPGILSKEEAEERLLVLEKKAYTISDSVGKMGVEAFYDEELRGLIGKKYTLCDAKGRVVKELGQLSPPYPGERVLLTISIELQEFVEQLLAENERIRDGRSYEVKREGKFKLKQPWIKGGAIIVLEPNTGEVLAMASYPRFDPNDFIPSGDLALAEEKRKRVKKWLELDDHLAEMWHQITPLERELYRGGEFVSDIKTLTWPSFLERVLPETSGIRSLIANKTIGDAIRVTLCAEEVQAKSPIKDLRKVCDFLFDSDSHAHYHKSLSQEEKKALTTFVKNPENERLLRQFKDYLHVLRSTYEQVLYIDLLALAIDPQKVDRSLVKKLENLTLDKFFDLQAAYCHLSQEVEKQCRLHFNLAHFSDWRTSEQKEFLKAKRQDEKDRKKSFKPYIDYLDEKEGQLFKAFWSQYRPYLVLALLEPSKATYKELTKTLPSEALSYVDEMNNWNQEITQGAHSEASWMDHYLVLEDYLRSFSLAEAHAFLNTLRSYHELNRPLKGSYPILRNQIGTQTEKDLAAAFYPKRGFGFTLSHAYRQATPQGSIFKIVTAYAGLLQKYRENPQKTHLDALNPLTITDDIFFPRGSSKMHVGYFPDGKPIPQHYKGGRIPKSQHGNIGQVNILGAIASSSNPYFALLAGEFLKDPNDLNHAASLLSYGSKTGLDLPGEFSGKLPKDLQTNKTGVYSYAIGQHTMVCTPLQSAVMLAAIANGGKIYQPRTTQLLIGEVPAKRDHSQEIASLNFDFASPSFWQKKMFSPTLVRDIELPKAVQQVLLESLKEGVSGKHGTARGSYIKTFAPDSETMIVYKQLEEEIIGKSSTAEFHDKVDLEAGKTRMYQHIWFGGISYKPGQLITNSNNITTFKTPELVVIVYLRYGDYGKEAAPLMARIVKKWREIEARNSAKENNLK